MREFPNATPRPWRCVGWMPCGIYGAGDLTDAVRIAQMDRRAEHDDNAALIVHAVNTYEERERLLEEAQNAFRLALEYWEDRQQRYRNRSPVWVKSARAFLAKLEARDA